jgi:hypothetical protein
VDYFEAVWEDVGREWGNVGDFGVCGVVVGGWMWGSAAAGLNSGLKLWTCTGEGE